MFISIRKRNPIKIFSIIFVLSLFAISQAYAEPVITDFSGTLIHDQTITITGSGFGSKNPAKPLVWADFQSSLNPSNLGIRTSWDAIGNMTWDATEKCAKGIPYLAEEWWKEGWAMSIDGVNWTADGQKVYVYRRIKMNFLITSTSQNWKSWRMWPSEINYPNIFVTYSHGTVLVEGINSGEYFEIDKIRPNTTDWRIEEIIFQASTYNQSNGSINYKRNGTVAGQYNQLMTRSSSHPAYMTQLYPVHGVSANATTWNPSWNSSNNYWADDVYVDNTWARVMICNSSNFNSYTYCVPQIPSAWSNLSITITLNQGSINNFNNAYLYVIDTDGNVNANGYPLCGNCPKTPANLRVQ